MDDQFFCEFFSRKQEITFNKQISGEISTAIQGGILEYVTNVISLPIADYLQYLQEMPRTSFIQPSDITQISHIELCRLEMCQAFERKGYQGLELAEIGEALHNDGVKRAKNTNAKYGENVKGAQQFGLVYRKDGKWFLSCLGYVYPLIDESQRDALISRVLLRDPLYSQLCVDAMNKDIIIKDYVEAYVYGSTIERRVGGVFSFMKIIENQTQREGITLFHQINRK